MNTKKWKLKGLYAVLSVAIPLFLILVGIAIMMYFRGGKKIDVIYEEIGKLFLQLGVIFVVGGLLKAIIDWTLNARTRLEKKHEDRNEFLTRVRKVYLVTENSKALLNAHRSARTYGKQLRRLMILKSVVIEIYEDLNAATDLFIKQESIKEGLDKIIGFFDNMENEYKERHADVDKGFRDKKSLDETIKNENMAWVKGFMNSEANYTNSFVKGIEMSKVAMRKEIYGA